MKFTVVWKSRAENELAENWEKSPQRRDMTRAADRVEEILRTSPEDAGEELPDLQGRVMFEGPIGVFFRVSAEDRLVEVVSVWSIAKP